MKFDIEFDKDKPNFGEMILYEKNGSWMDGKLLERVLNRAKLVESRLSQEGAVVKHEIVINHN